MKHKMAVIVGFPHYTKSAGNCGFGQITEEILNGKLHFLCSAQSNYICLPRNRIPQINNVAEGHSAKTKHDSIMDGCFWILNFSKYLTGIFLSYSKVLKL